MPSGWSRPRLRQGEAEQASKGERSETFNAPASHFAPQLLLLITHAFCESMPVACHHCSQPIHHRHDLVTAARFVRVRPFHADCFSEKRGRQPWASGRRLNSRKGTQRALLSASLVAAFIYLVAAREGFHGDRAPLQLPALVLIIALALVPALARITSYLRYERLLTEKTPG